MWVQEGGILSSLTRPSTGKITPQNLTAMDHFADNFKQQKRSCILQQLHQILGGRVEQSFRTLHKLSHHLISPEFPWGKHYFLSPTRCSSGHQQSTEETSQILVSKGVSNIRNKCNPSTCVKLCCVPQGLPLIPHRLDAHMWFQFCTIR